MREQELNPESLRRIGMIFFTAVLLLSLSSLFIIKEYILIRYYTLNVSFNFVADLKRGADVRFTGGYRVGYVKAIESSGSGIVVRLAIREDFSVREKAEVSLFTMGLMGERFIELDQTGGSGDYVKPGSTLKGNDAFSIEIFQLNMARLTQNTVYSKDAVIPTFQELLRNLNKGLASYNGLLRSKRPGTSHEIRAFRENTALLLSRIMNTRAFIERLKKGLQGFDREKVNALFLGIRELEGDLSSLNVSLKNFIEISRNLNYETGAILKQENAMGRLIFGNDVYNALEKQLSDLEDYSEKIADNPNMVFAK
jgi:phospholipid/cholesterol/gamma-HCH transport system substrate-binding protein